MYIPQLLLNYHFLIGKEPIDLVQTNMKHPVKDGVVKVDVSSIGTKFENFVQAGCRELGLHHGRTV